MRCCRFLFALAGLVTAARAQAPAPRLEFALFDAHGVEVRASDYRGAALWMVFGACW